MRQELTPTLLQDSREQCPLRFENLPVEVVGLPVGDYGIRGFSDWENPAFIIERKNLEDLCHSLGKSRERFLRECEKMRAFRFKALVIEGTQDMIELKQYRSVISPQAIISTLDALSVRCGIQVFWCADAAGAARRVESLAMMFVRGIQKDYWRLVAPAVLESESKVA